MKHIQKDAKTTNLNNDRCLMFSGWRRMLSLDDQVVRGGCSSHVVFLFLSFLWLPNSLGSAAPGRWKASWTLGWPMFSAVQNSSIGDLVTHSLTALHYVAIQYPSIALVLKSKGLVLAQF